MIHRALLVALDEAARAGSIEGASAALRPFDPLVRWRARVRLRQVTARARLATSSGDAAHLARVAFLVAAVGTPGADYDDEAAIRSEYEALRTAVRAPYRGPVVTATLAFLVLLGVALAVAVPTVTRPFDPRREPVGRALASDVPAFVVALSRPAPDAKQVAHARGAATSPAVRRALGGEAEKAYDELLAATEELATAPREQRASLDRFTAGAASFDRALAARGLPYFVDTDTLGLGGRLVPILLSFYVEREAELVAGDVRVRAVHLWRLDDLNLVQGYLGYTRPSAPAALVLLDQIEADLVRFVLPALPEGEGMTLVDAETEVSGEEWVAPLQTWAGDQLRRHYARAPAAQAATGKRVAQLLARRRALVAKWRKDLAGLGHLLRVPERLVPEADYAAELALRVPRAELGEWDDLHAELSGKAALEAFLAFRRDYASSVERHEVQHRLDYRRGLAPIPALLCEMLGKDDPLDAPEGSLAARARDELSAYLASAVVADHTPLLELLLLSRHLFDRGSLGGIYWYTALATFRALADELGLDASKLLGRGAVSREKSAALVRAVLERAPDELRAAATRVYEKSFAQKVPDVRVVSARDNRPWRH